MTITLNSTDTLTTACDKLQALREKVYPANTNKRKARARISAFRYIEWYYKMYDMIPTDEAVSEYLVSRNYRKAQLITQSAFGELEAQGILTEVGRFTGHRHLTYPRGYEYYEGCDKMRTIKALKEDGGYAYVGCVCGADRKPIYWAYIVWPTMDSGYPVASSIPDDEYRKIDGRYQRVYWNGREYVLL